MNSKVPSFLAKEVLTAALAWAVALGIFALLPHHHPAPVNVTVTPGMYFPHPGSDPYTSHAALKSALESGKLVIFGSSELTIGGEVAPQKFLPRVCGRGVVVVGSAGFQSLMALYSLAELQDSIGPQSKVAVILSPVWFTEKGTSSESFLKDLSPQAMARLMSMTGISEDARQALRQEARHHHDQFTGLYPDWLYLDFPFLARLVEPRLKDWPPFSVSVEPVAAATSNYAAELEFWKQKYEKEAGGNPLGMLHDRYEHFLKDHPAFPGKHVEPWILDPLHYERDDLYALSEFLKSRGVKAEFIMQPVHRGIYKASGLAEYDKLFVSVEKKLRDDGHEWINYFAEPYDLTLLSDSQHFSEYAWARLQKRWCP